MKRHIARDHSLIANVLPYEICSKICRSEREMKKHRSMLECLARARQRELEERDYYADAENEMTVGEGDEKRKKDEGGRDESKGEDNDDNKDKDQETEDGDEDEYEDFDEDEETEEEEDEEDEESEDEDDEFEDPLSSQLADILAQGGERAGGMGAEGEGYVLSEYQEAIVEDAARRVVEALRELDN